MDAATQSTKQARVVRSQFEQTVLLLQGGGALGSYQAGVYQALAEADLHPDWVAGISIGAINAALIAGNPPERRVERLREFQPTLKTEIDTLVGRLHHGLLQIAVGAMGYKHKQADLAAVSASLAAPNFLLKIIPHVDGTARICELVEYRLEDVTLKGAWTGPAQLVLASHPLAPLAELPVLEIVSGIHIVADLTLGLGKVVHDYLA